MSNGGFEVHAIGKMGANGEEQKQAGTHQHELEPKRMAWKQSQFLLFPTLMT